MGAHWGVHRGQEDVCRMGGCWVFFGGQSSHEVSLFVLCPSGGFLVRLPSLVAQSSAIGVSVAATPPCAAIRFCKELFPRHSDRGVAR